MASSRASIARRDEIDLTLFIQYTELVAVNDLTQKFPHIETGGDLFGVAAPDGSVHVQFVIGPGQQVRRNSVSFYQDEDYLARSGSILVGQRGLHQLGQWHSHHQLGLMHPSGGDCATVWDTLRTTQTMNRFVVCIATLHGPGPLRLSLNPYLFDKARYIAGDTKPLRMRLVVLHTLNPLRGDVTLVRDILAGAENEGPVAPQSRTEYLVEGVIRLAGGMFGKGRNKKGKSAAASASKSPPASAAPALDVAPEPAHNSNCAVVPAPAADSVAMQVSPTPPQAAAAPGLASPAPVSAASAPVAESSSKKKNKKKKKAKQSGASAAVQEPESASPAAPSAEAPITLSPEPQAVDKQLPAVDKTLDGDALLGPSPSPPIADDARDIGDASAAIDDSAPGITRGLPPTLWSQHPAGQGFLKALIAAVSTLSTAPLLRYTIKQTLQHELKIKFYLCTRVSSGRFSLLGDAEIEYREAMLFFPPDFPHARAGLVVATATSPHAVAAAETNASVWTPDVAAAYADLQMAFST